MANNGHNAINYFRLLTKLKADLPETIPKKPRNANKFYPSEEQRRLLDVCSFKVFLEPHGFDIVREVNQFVTEYVEYRKDFGRILGGLLCPGMYLMSRITI